jgi:hypothetical protein
MRLLEGDFGVARQPHGFLRDAKEVPGGAENKSPAPVVC